MSNQILRNFIKNQKFKYEKKIIDSGVTLWSVDTSNTFRRFVNPIKWIELENTITLDLSTEEGSEKLANILKKAEASAFQLTLIFLPPSVIGIDHYDFPKSWATFDENTLQKIIKSKRPKATFANYIRNRVPLRCLSPYQTNYVVSGRMFFGRDVQISDVIGKPNENFAIFGPRRIGKSSLAKEIMMRINREKGAAIRLGVDRYAYSVAYVDCNTIPNLSEPEDSFFEIALNSMGIEARDTTLNRKLFGQRFRYLTPFEFFEKLVTTKYKKGMTLIIDEIDGLLERQKESSWSLLKKIQGLIDRFQPKRNVEEGKANILLVGFTELYKDIYDQSFPFYGRCNTMMLSNLGMEATRRLILEPMRELGIRVHNDQDIVNRIRNYTGGMPSVVQSLCAEAIRNLEQVPSPNNRILTPELVQNIIETQAPLTDSINWFDFMTNDIEKIIVYYAAPLRGLVIDKFLQHLRLKNISGIIIDDLRFWLDRLTLANIFKEIQRHRSYEFAVEAFRRVVENRLKKNVSLDSLLERLGREQ